MMNTAKIISNNKKSLSCNTVITIAIIITIIIIIMAVCKYVPISYKIKRDGLIYTLLTLCK